MLEINAMRDLDKVLSQIEGSSIEFFGCEETVTKFINLVCHTGSVALAGQRLELAPLMLHSVIKKDVSLKYIVSLAKEYAKEVAEGILYERAVHGYEEETHNEGDGNSKKKKYSDRALVDYLRANDQKYKTKSNGQVAGGYKQNDPLQIELLEF